MTPQLAQLVMGDADRVSRAALHALAASLAIAPQSAPKQHPFPWSNPSAGGSTPTRPTHPTLLAVIGNKYSSRFSSAVLNLLVVPPASSPRNSHVSTIDPSAVELLYALVTECPSDTATHILTSPLAAPLIAAAIPTTRRSDGPAPADWITQCQSAGILATSLSSEIETPGWVTMDTARSLANALTHPHEAVVPWVFSYRLDLLVAMLCRLMVSPTTPSRQTAQARLREALLSLATVVHSDTVKFWSDFLNIEELRRIEARPAGSLNRGPLDGPIGLCNAVARWFEGGSGAACRRLLRGLMAISGGGIRGVISLCGPAGLLALAECLSTALTTSSSDSGSASSAKLIKELLAVLQSVVTVAEMRPELDKRATKHAFNSLLDTMIHLCSEDGLPAEVTEALAGGNFVPGLINAVSVQFGPSRSSLGVLALLMQGSSTGTAASQFVSAKGLEMIRRFALLGPETDAETLSETVSIVSNLARAGSEHYAPIHEKLGPYSDFLHILHGTDLPVTAKVCNAIGNMSRHSDFFYPHLAGLIPALIAVCGCGDVGCKKFASFAIGNIAFHSAALYPDLRAAVPVLVSLLGDDDEKTRANSAGALGNLVRNSSALVNCMLAKSAVEALLTLVKNGIDSSGRIALFSLGNLAMHAASKELLLRLRCGALVQKVAANAKANGDAQTVKYCTRLLGKLA